MGAFAGNADCRTHFGIVCNTVTDVYAFAVHRGRPWDMVLVVYGFPTKVHSSLVIVGWHLINGMMACLIDDPSILAMDHCCWQAMSFLLMF